MIDRFFGDAFWFSSCLFRSSVLQCGARLSLKPSDLELLAVQSVVPVF